MNLTSDSGEVRWKINVSIPSGENELERLSDVVGTPLVLGDTVCMAAFQGRLGCYQLDSGRLNWSFKVSAVGSLGFDQDDVFVADEFGDVVALDGKTGAVIWRNNSFKFRRLTGPTVLGRWVLVGDVDGMVLMLDAKNGSLVGTVKTDGSPILVNPLVIDDKVIIQTSKGNLYAFVLDQDF
jgi:outer membrane protein assembly factor BamB